MQALSDKQLLTPVYLKTGDFVWPSGENAFYLLSREGLSFCRNHPFWQSSVAATKGPSGLASHESFLQLRFPKLPQRRLEILVGFFYQIAESRGAEAGALLVWDRQRCRLRVVVPRQLSRVGFFEGHLLPVDLAYSIPQLPPHLLVVGDCHCHANLPAQCSPRDARDMLYRDGMHCIVGGILREPPEFSVEFSVDGQRFQVEPSEVFEGYGRRATQVPRSWISQVRVEHVEPDRLWSPPLAIAHRVMP